MAQNNAAIEMFNSVVVTDEDRRAFEAGYLLSKDPDYRARLGGFVINRGAGSTHVLVDDVRKEATWLDGRELKRNGMLVVVEDPSFILGTVVAALEHKQATARAET